MSYTKETLGLRWRIALAIAAIVFVNHYTRDSVGALEKQLEEEIMTVKQYHAMNALFFAPNIISPVIAGAYFIKYVGGPVHMLIQSVAFAALGHLVFAQAVFHKNVGLIMLGRFMTGTCYEVIDMIPLIVLEPLLKENWGFVVGILNAFLRCGSILNFVVSPLVFVNYNIEIAIFLSALAGLLGVPLAAYTLLATDKLKNDGTARIEDTDLNAINKKLATRNSGQNKDSSFRWKHFSLFEDYYWWYVLASMMTYGSMIPFWFIGSKFLQDHYGLSVVGADLLMLLPEGCIVVVGPVLGCAIDYWRLGTRSLLMMLSFSILCLPLAYMILISGPHAPLGATDVSIGTYVTNDAFPVAIFGMILCGTGYAFSNCLIWTLCNKICSNDFLDVQLGILACSLNLAPFVLIVISAIQYDEDEQQEQSGHSNQASKIALSNTEIALDESEKKREIGYLAICGVIGFIMGILAYWRYPAEAEADDDNDGDDDDGEEVAGRERGDDISAQKQSAWVTGGGDYTGVGLNINHSEL